MKEEEILYPNCSETVIRLKYEDIDALDDKELKIYKDILSKCWAGDETMGWEYSKLRGDKTWKAHYIYQSVCNDLVAFAYWIGIDFDTDESWHANDIIFAHEEKDYDLIAEWLSKKFTEFENYEDRNKK